MRHLFALMLAAAAQLALAQPAAPDALIRNLSEEVLAAIRRDPKAIAALVETKLVPHFDFRRATQIAVGKSWREASAAQQEKLTGQFKTLLIRTYSGALAAYRDQTIEVLPLRGAAAGDAEVTVRSRVKQPGAEPIAIEYDLAKTESGWKVFDVRVAGMSLVATYRTSFTEEIRNRGIDGLIATLAAKNGTSL